MSSGDDAVLTFTREPPGGLAGHRGRIDSELIAEAGIDDGTAFVCGSNGFVEAASESAARAGLRAAAGPHRALRPDRLMEALEDGHRRRIEDLRVSVTDRCNFRCQYCMPPEGLGWMERSEVLGFEEIERLARLFVSLGIGSIRLTGGEPLVRPSFPELVARLAAIPGLHDLSLTTNGYLLERDANALVEAGIQRVNVSIDSLQRDRFFQIARRTPCRE